MLDPTLTSLLIIIISLLYYKLCLFVGAQQAGRLRKSRLGSYGVPVYRIPSGLTQAQVTGGPALRSAAGCDRRPVV